ncbi:MAG: MoaD/ThiS family protein [Candidatus Nanohaloarchaea archaeon]
MTLVRDDLDSEKRSEMELEDGVTVSGLLELEGINREEVLVSRNGTIVSGGHELEDGDTVTVRDVIAGG